MAPAEAIDTQVFGPSCFAEADAQTTLPTAKVQANIKTMQLPREACQSLRG